MHRDGLSYRLIGRNLGLSKIAVGEKRLLIVEVAMPKAVKVSMRQVLVA
jgi:hypothetical protein